MSLKVIRNHTSFVETNVWPAFSKLREQNIYRPGLKSSTAPPFCWILESQLKRESSPRDERRRIRKRFNFSVKWMNPGQLNAECNLALQPAGKQCSGIKEKTEEEWKTFSRSRKCSAILLFRSSTVPFVNLSIKKKTWGGVGEDWMALAVHEWSEL